MTRYFKEDLWYEAEAEAELRVEARAAKSIAAQVGRVLGAKPFPIAATRLAELTRSPDAPLYQVVDVLESDPALSARLLRLVNSAGYALRTACTSVGHAAALVGTEKLNQVATTAAILDMYDGSTPAAANILEHATVVGGFCRYLAVHLGLPPDELFTCGFLHDIGKLMLLDCEGESYLSLLRAVNNEPDVIHIRERELYGYDHALLAGHVLAAWNIPDPVPKVVAWHHQAARAYDDPLIARMVAVVRFSDAASYSIFRPLPEPEIERLARTEAASYLEISEAQIAAMWPDLQALASKSRAGFRGEEMPAAVAEKARPGVLRGDNPANDNQLPAAADPSKAPQTFPCVVCGIPSYANQCPACHGYMCPAHQRGEDEWCSLCRDEFHALQLKFPRWVYVAIAGVVGATVIASVLGASSALTGRTLKLILTPGLGALFLGVLLFVWRRWLRRFWFLRTVADRTGLAPVVTDELANGLAALPPSSKRVINPFDKASLQPAAAFSPPANLQYYSLPPPLSLGPSALASMPPQGAEVMLSESDQLSEVQNLGDSDVLRESLAVTDSSAAETDADDPFAATGADDALNDDPFAATDSDEATNDDPFATTDSDEAPNDDPFAEVSANDAIANDPFAATSADDTLNDDPFAATDSDEAADNDPFAEASADNAIADDPFAATSVDDALSDDPFAESALNDAPSLQSPTPTDDTFGDDVFAQTATDETVADNSLAAEIDDPFAATEIDDSPADAKTDDLFANDSANDDPFAELSTQQDLALPKAASDALPETSALEPFDVQDFAPSQDPPAAALDASATSLNTSALAEGRGAHKRKRNGAKNKPRAVRSKNGKGRIPASELGAPAPKPNREDVGPLAATPSPSGEFVGTYTFRHPHAWRAVAEAHGAADGW